MQHRNYSQFYFTKCQETHSFTCHLSQQPASYSCGLPLIPLGLLSCLSAPNRMQTATTCWLIGGVLATWNNSLTAFCAWRGQKYNWETTWILVLALLSCMTLDISASYLRVLCRWLWKIIIHHSKFCGAWFRQPKSNCLREKT